MADIKNTPTQTNKQSNRIIKGIDKVSGKMSIASKKVQAQAAKDAIKVNGEKTPFRASSLVASEIDANLRKVINNTNKDFSDFVNETQRYLADNYAIKLTKKDLEVIAKKGSTITDELIANTTILKNDIQGMLTQNLAKGVSDKQLAQELTELYPAYARNAGTILNSGLGRLFIDTNVAKFTENNLEFYLYAGPDDKVTRDRPCKHWVWKWFPKKDLDIVAATRLQLWNCRHSIIAITEEQTENYERLDTSFAS